MRPTSAFSFIKGDPTEEDDVVSTTSSSASSYASGYDSTLSSIDSFIDKFGGGGADINASDITIANLNLTTKYHNGEGSQQQSYDNSRSPSLSTFSNNSGYIDVGRIKIEDGEGE